MLDDADIQVWLDDAAASRPGVIVPYVRSSSAVSLQYRLRVIRRGPRGSSELNQRGAVDLEAVRPTPLGRIQLNGAGDEECRIEIQLLEADQPRATHRFSCPP